MSIKYRAKRGEWMIDFQCNKNNYALCWGWQIRLSTLDNHHCPQPPASGLPRVANLIYHPQHKVWFFHYLCFDIELSLKKTTICMNFVPPDEWISISIKNDLGMNNHLLSLIILIQTKLSRILYIFIFALNYTFIVHYLELWRESGFSLTFWIWNSKWFWCVQLKP